MYKKNAFLCFYVAICFGGAGYASRPIFRSKIPVQVAPDPQRMEDFEQKKGELEETYFKTFCAHDYLQTYLAFGANRHSYSDEHLKFFDQLSARNKPLRMQFYMLIGAIDENKEQCRKALTGCMEKLEKVYGDEEMDLASKKLLIEEIFRTVRQAIQCLDFSEEREAISLSENINMKDQKIDKAYLDFLVEKTRIYKEEIEKYLNSLF